MGLEKADSPLKLGTALFEETIVGFKKSDFPLNFGTIFVGKLIILKGEWGVVSHGSFGPSPLSLSCFYLLPWLPSSYLWVLSQYSSMHVMFPFFGHLSCTPAYYALFSGEFDALPTSQGSQ